jgi:hypothetical protein
MTVDLGAGISGVRGSSFRKIGVGCVPTSRNAKSRRVRKIKPPVVTNGHVGGRLREELPKIGISGNGESELAHVHYPDTRNHDMITVVDRGDSTGP